MSYDDVSIENPTDEELKMLSDFCNLKDPTISDGLEVLHKLIECDQFLLFEIIKNSYNIRKDETDGSNFLDVFNTFSFGMQHKFGLCKTTENDIAVKFVRGKNYYNALDTLRDIHMCNSYFSIQPTIKDIHGKRARPLTLQETVAAIVEDFETLKHGDTDRTIQDRIKLFNKSFGTEIYWNTICTCSAFVKKDEDRYKFISLCEPLIQLKPNYIRENSDEKGECVLNCDYDTIDGIKFSKEDINYLKLPGYEGLRRDGLCPKKEKEKLLQSHFWNEVISDKNLLKTFTYISFFVNYLVRGSDVGMYDPIMRINTGVRSEDLVRPNIIIPIGMTNRTGLFNLQFYVGGDLNSIDTFMMQRTIQSNERTLKVSKEAQYANTIKSLNYFLR